ncbi:unnamed protein product, partial [Closterium sp. NIES-65]
MPNGARSAQITTSPIEAGSTGNVCARSWMVQQRAALSSYVMPCRVWFPSNPFVGFRPRSAALKPTSPPNVAPGIPPPAPSIPFHPIPSHLCVAAGPFISPNIFKAIHRYRNLRSSSPASPAIMLPSVAVALMLLAASIPASDAKVRSGCIRNYQCPRRGSNQCGLYYVCSNSANPKPPYTLQTCDTCAFRDNVNAYAQVCNYETGRCNVNKIDGKPCATDKQCGPSGQFKCLVNKNSKAKPQAKRCC